MSFVRFGEDGSHVYIYPESAATLYCCGCSLDPRATALDHDQMIEHIRHHRDAGDHVPDWVDDDIRSDRDHRTETGDPPGLAAVDP